VFLSLTQEKDNFVLKESLAVNCTIPLSLFQNVQERTGGFALAFLKMQSGRQSWSIQATSRILPENNTGSIE
jgi:hypothetical protein